MQSDANWHVWDFANVFSTQLISGLPSVADTLGISGCGQGDLHTLVPVVVSLTVPRVMTRAMFNQGVQVRDSPCHYIGQC